MKLLFIISTLNTGGAQRALSNLVCGLPKEWEIDILLNDNSKIEYPYQGRILTLGLKPKEDKLSIGYQTLVAIKRIKTVWRLKKYGGYDACISFLESANIINVITGKKKCKVVLSCRAHLTRSCENSNIYKFLIKPLVSILYNYADKIVSVSKSIEEDLINNFGIRPDKIETIYNGVSIDKNISDTMKANKTCDGKYYITTMGRLEPQKGQWHLLKAYKEYLKIYPQSVLQILGDGSLREQLERLVDELGIKSNVEFVGFTSYPQEYVAKSDLFVFPSIFEGFPNALVEAMACGVPVIATDCDSGCREILAPDTPVSYKNVDKVEYAKYGVLVPVGSGVPNWEANIELTVDERSIFEAMSELRNNGQDYKKYACLATERAGMLTVYSMINKWKTILE